MPVLGPFEAWIETSPCNTRFQEHQVVSTETKKAECFIESKSGLRFKIMVKRDHQAPFVGHDAWRVAYHVDGQEIMKKVMAQSTHPVVELEGVPQDMTTIIPFQFGATHFTGINFGREESDFGIEDGGTDKGLLAGLGSIVVKILRVDQLGQYDDQSFRPVQGFKKEKKVHETAKKSLLTHSIQYISSPCSPA
jgi:hypothetical protein